MTKHKCKVHATSNRNRDFAGSLAEVEPVGNNVRCHVCKEDLADRDALKIHMQLQVQLFLCTECDYKSAKQDNVQQHAKQQHKQPSINAKENNVKPISPSQAEQSQSTCKTWGLPKVVTAADNVSCDVCKQKFPDRGALEIHMQSHMPQSANCDDL